MSPRDYRRGSSGALGKPVDEPRIHLSPPSVSDIEMEAVQLALASGWIAPLGPEVDAFEEEIRKQSGRMQATSLSSGTAGLHLGLLALGVTSGDEVIVPTLTFGATAFAVSYTGADPIFVDVEDASWNLDADMLERVLRERFQAGRLPKAIVTVDVFGRTCDYDRILPLANDCGVPVLVDAAEALGATYKDRPAGSMGHAAVFSFNGNKIITTSGGGALVTDDPELAQKVRKLSTQSREPMPWYQHEEIGYNYRMSNILAALGRAQLSRLPDIIERRRAIRNRYASEFENVRGLTVMGDPPWGRWNGWLTTVRFDSRRWPDAPTLVREALESHNIEARPVWKPMHAQPVFRDAEAYLTGVADSIFAEGLCLPSGTGMTDEDVDRVAGVVREALVVA